MKLNILKPVKKKKNPKNTYRVNMTFMMGDADGYSEESVDFPEAKYDDLIKFLETLFKCKRAFPHGRGGSRKYSYYTVDGYEENIMKYMDDRWPYDPMGDIEQTIDSFYVVYYDKAGIERDVEIVE